MYKGYACSLSLSHTHTQTRIHVVILFDLTMSHWGIQEIIRWFPVSFSRLSLLGFITSCLVTRVPSWTLQLCGMYYDHSAISKPLLGVFLFFVFTFSTLPSLYMWGNVYYQSSRISANLPVRLLEIPVLLHLFTSGSSCYTENKLGCVMCCLTFCKGGQV